MFLFFSNSFYFDYFNQKSNATTTRRLKKLLMNQRVHVTLHSPSINGFHPVEIRLADKKILNEILLSDETKWTETVKRNELSMKSFVQWTVLDFETDARGTSDSSETSHGRFESSATGSFRFDRFD